MGRLRERDSESPRHAPKAVRIIYGIFLPGFLWTVIQIHVVHKSNHANPYLVYLRTLAYVHTHLLAKMDSAAKACGQGTSLDITPFWPPRSLFCTCVVRKVSRLQEKNMWSRQGPTFSLLPLFSSWSFSQWGMNLQLLYPIGGRGEHLLPALAPVGKQLPKVFRILVIPL